MFRAITPQRLTNDQGVEVSSRGRYGMRYQDGDHVLMLYCDAMVDDNGRFGSAIVLPRDPRWQPPYDQEPIDDAQRQAIAENLVAAWRAAGTWVKIEVGTNA